MINVLSFLRLSDRKGLENVRLAPQERRSPLQWAPAPQHHAHAADPRTNFPPPDPVPPKCGSRDNCAGIFKPLHETMSDPGVNHRILNIQVEM